MQQWAKSKILRQPSYCRMTARAIIWFTSYFPNLSFFQLTAQGGLPENPGTIFYETFVQTENSCCVCHDFHWLLVATKLLTAKLHARYVKELDILESSELESDVVLPTAQPWQQESAYYL